MDLSIKMSGMIFEMIMMRMVSIVMKMVMVKKKRNQLLKMINHGRKVALELINLSKKHQHQKRENISLLIQ